MNQKVAMGFLARLGYEAAVASNGAEAVEMAAANDYDLILMDVQMPEMDGLDATRAIRAAAAAHTPRIVAMTANVLEEEREQCRLAGMEDFVPKPVRIDELEAALVAASQLGN